MADISYTPTTWADGAEGGTPINSTRLNNIESGIVDAVAAIGPNDTTADGTLKAQIDALGDSVSLDLTERLHFYKRGNICIVVFDNVVGASAKSWNTIYTLPAEYRPSHVCYAAAFNTTTTDEIGRIVVANDGKCQVWPQVANTAVYGEVVYAI